MTELLEIQPVSVPIRASVRPPGSKSITNRALVCAALAEGTSTLRGALDSEDTRVMIDGLRQLGVEIESKDSGQTLVVTGSGGSPPARQADIFVANSGTTIRFLTAVACLGNGQYSLDGIQRMRERPIKDLVDALQQIGADLDCAGRNGCPPVAIRGKGLQGGTCTIRGDLSSQFLSGLLMSAPYAQNEVELRVQGTLVSVPYVRMTLAIMQSFGVSVQHNEDFTKLKISNGTGYRKIDYTVEPDASAASYFWAAAAITGGEVTVEGLSSKKSARRR